MKNKFKTQTGLILMALVLLTSNTYACLTFSLKHKDQLIYGRNFDWDSGAGAVFVNPRHITKTAFVLPPEKPLSWTATYGSVTFNPFSREFPVGGMNEKGLVIECMVSTAEHPGPDKRSAVNELQWIQYHLDTCKTVDDVIRSAKKVRITPFAVNLHYFMTDSTGASAAVEFLNGKMIDRSGKSLPVKVLANTRYDQALKASESQNSRFSRCSRMIREYDGKKEAASYAFIVLDAVSQGDYTKWQVVYDIPRMRIAFRTLANHKSKKITLSDIDFTHASEALMIDVNMDGEGPVMKQFMPYSEERNISLMKASLDELKKTGMMQHIKPELMEAIRTVVASCKTESKDNSGKAE